MNDYLNTLNIILSSEYTGFLQTIFVLITTGLLVLRGNRNGNGLLTRVGIIEHDLKEIKKIMDKQEIKYSKDYVESLTVSKSCKQIFSSIVVALNKRIIREN